MNTPNIINIQKYSIHDGPGIRTTVFFKGCPLSCLWCHNPESQSYQKEVMFSGERCVKCNACSEVCPQKAISKDDILTDRSKCDLCQTCINVCVKNAREIVGKQYTIKELMKEIEKDFMFYEESGGGVTLSGGEVMTQDIDYIEELLKKLEKKGIHIAVDTCGYAPYENFARVMPFVHAFLYDVKVIDCTEHKRYMGLGNELILDNLKKISDAGACIFIRIPIINEVNADDKTIDDIISFLKENISVQSVNLLPYHNTGSGKYEKLGGKYEIEKFTTPDTKRMDEIKAKFLENGYNNVFIGG